MGKGTKRFVVVIICSSSHAGGGEGEDLKSGVLVIGWWSESRLLDVIMRGEPCAGRIYLSGGPLKG